MKDTEKVVETVETNVEEVVENQSEGLLSKTKTGVKKYGKKIAVTAGIVAVGLLGYAFGSKSKKDDNNTDGIIDGNYTFVSDDNTEE